MAKKGMPINGHDYTPDMLKALQRVRRKHGMALREYLVQWQKANQDKPLRALADEMGCDPSTLYAWLRNLDLVRAHLILPRKDYLRLTGQPIPEEVEAAAARDEQEQAAAALRSLAATGTEG